MSSAVAMVGRDREIAELLPELEKGGCVIAGPAGVGKSRLAAELADRSRAPVLRILATEAASSIPFGAFGHVASGSGLSDHLGVIRRFGGLHPATLVVDDAHLLDPASASLLVAILQSRTAKLIATLRNGEAAPDAVTSLWKDLQLTRLELAPLSRRDVERLVETVLGATVEPGVLDRIVGLSAGSPLYAMELVRAAVGSGALDRVEDSWDWTGGPLELTRLRDLIGARTRRLAPDARRALELLAVGAPLWLDDLVTAAGSEAGLEVLERAGLAEVRCASESPEVHLAQPLYGEVILAGLTTAAARRHRRRLASTIGARSPERRADLLRRAALVLDAGDRDPDLFLRASAEALQSEAGVPAGWGKSQVSLAVRLADAAGDGLSAALAGARGRLALGRHAEVRERLSPMEGQAALAPPAQASAYVRTLAYAMHWGGAGPAAVREFLERSQHWRATPDWQAQHAVLTAWVLLDDGRPASAGRVVQPWIEASGLDVRTRLDALTSYGVALGRCGLIDRCEALEPQLHRIVADLEATGSDTGWSRYLVDGLARAAAARELDAVSRRLHRERRRLHEAGEAPLAAALAMVLGRTELLRGHAHEAIELLEDAAHDLTTGDARNGLGLALAHLARAAATAGDVERAEKVLDRGRAVSAERPENRYLAIEIEHANAWAQASRGRVDWARRRLLALAEDAREPCVQQAELLHGAMRLGAEPGLIAPRLQKLAGEAESDLLDAFAAHASALVDGAADAQLAAAECYADLGLDLLAAESATVAARTLRQTGRQRAADRAKAFAALHAGRCAEARTPGLNGVPAADALTPREREVAVLAAAGHTNQQIASELVLSVRSVETYVLRACRKLGAGARGDLAERLRGAR